MIALSHDMLLSCQVTAGFLLVAFHANSERECLQSWLLQVLRCAKLRRQPRAKDAEDNAHIRQMTDETRAKWFKAVVRYCLVGFAFIMIAVMNNRQTVNIGVCAWCLFIYSVGLFVVYSPIQWTPTRITAITALANFAMLVRTFFIQDQGVWFLQSSTRALFRLLTAILDMDLGRVALWNLLFSFVNIFKTVEMAETLPALQRRTEFAFIVEGTISMLLWVISYIAQIWVIECARIAYDASASRAGKSMADHLLSAFCDAQVKLGPNLELVGDHQKLSLILLARSSAGSELLQGTSFLDYLANADRVRFKAFVDASSAPSRQCASIGTEDLYERPKTLPSALHVHLRDLSGRSFPATIFHSPAMSAERASYHLIGICVNSLEECTEAQQIVRDSTERPQDDSHSSRAHKVRSSSMSSRSSSSSGRSKMSSHLIDLPWIDKLSITFDPFEWSISQFCWNASQADETVGKVDEYMLQPDGREFRQWAQDKISRLLFTVDEEPDEKRRSPVYGSLTLNLPNAFRSKPIAIFSKHAWLDLEDLADVEDGEYSLVTLQLEGVHQISDRGRPNAVMSTIGEECLPKRAGKM